MPIRIDRPSASGTPTRAGQSARDTGISRWERCEWTLLSPLCRPPHKATAWTRPGRRSSRPSNRGPSAGDAGESTGDHCAIDERREQSSASATPAAPTGAAGTPASAGSHPPAGRRRRPQHGIRVERRNTAGYGHRRRKGKRQAGS